MASKGVRWELADKSPGSRKQGWEQMRKLLRQSLNVDHDGRPLSGPRELPGMFFFRTCQHAIDLLPSMPRDDDDLDDIDTDAEDHIADEVRYRARNIKRATRVRDF
jgi:hypothetical protein